jgi:SAM-dependent methyltransferase
MIILENSGYCSTCTKEVKFVANNPWFRDYYLCSECGILPRERAIMQVIEEFFPSWQDLVIHECSPAQRGASHRLSNQCNNYISSQFFPDCQLGSFVNGFRCESLECLTFENESIDLHISQDVMEHIFCPSKAFSEIARTLKPGGAHIFTLPLVNKSRPSKLRARLNANGEVVHLEEPQYHGNPISEDGSLVTVDWGFDICKYIYDASGLFTHIIKIDDLSKGIRAEYIEVLVTVKPKLENTENEIP